MKTFGQRLKEVRKDRGYKSQQALANKIGGGLTHVSISCWENDTYMPDRDNAEAIKQILKVNWNYLLHGKEPKYLDQSLGSELISYNDNIYKYPVLDWGSIKKGDEMNTVSAVAEMESAYNGKECFGLVVNNESMFPEFKVGEFILIDKLAKIQSGDYCIISQADGSYILRQYIVDGNDVFIKTVNPDWPSKLKHFSDDMLIIGKVVQAQRDYT